MKKICTILSILIMTICFSISVNAYNEVLCSGFETEDELSLWYGAYFDDSNPYTGNGTAFVSNPFGLEINGLITHVLEYYDKVYLEAGKTYSLSGAVMNPMSDYSPSLKTHAELEYSANTIIVSVVGAGDSWDEFTTNFYASETGYYNIAFHIEKGVTDFGFFVDDIKLYETDLSISTLSILGPDSVIVPVEGTIQVKYTPVFKSIDNTEINILTSSTIRFNITQAQGIYFDSTKMLLNVSSDAIPDTVLTLDCSLDNFEHLTVHSTTITLSDNLLNNSDFSNGNENWFSSSYIQMHPEDSGYISVPTNDYSTFGYYTTLSYDSSLVLEKDALYVLRAKIKTDSPHQEYPIYAKNTSFLQHDTVVFNITDISGDEWTEVFSAFVPERTGIYNLAVNFSSIYDCTFYIDDVRLCVEKLRPTYLTLHAPGNIAIPDTQTSFTLSSLVRDQLGNVLDDEKCYLSLDNENGSVTFDSYNNELTIFPDSIAGEYILRATSCNHPDITASIPITIGHDFIGDGTFENKRVNEWWVTSSPYYTDFSVHDDGNSKKAHIECMGDYFILLNNSYMHLIAGMPYVFNISPIISCDATITAFIENMDGEEIPLVQFEVNEYSDKTGPELFLCEEDIVGRVFLYIQSNYGEPLIADIDNISFKKAVIKAANPHVSGELYVNGYAKTEFSFYNSIANTTSTDSAVINWYIGDSPSGEFIQLSLGGEYIYFDTTFGDKYVYFDVTPVCPITGFSGETIKSTPFKVSFSTDGGYTPPDDSYVIPELGEQTSPQPPQNPDQTPSTTMPFTDITNHWGANYIKALSKNSYVNGKSNGLFFPDDYISRAEISKIISKAFSIKAKTQTDYFIDVSPDMWCYQYINALYENKITSGTSYNTFSPEKYITRQEFAVFAMRICYLLKNDAYEMNANKIFINDIASVEPWAMDSINFVITNKIMGINTQSCFLPRNYTTRAEACAIIYRLLNIIK